jgi:tetratricopeptide (TPR) repeat protein
MLLRVLLLTGALVQAGADEWKTAIESGNRLLSAGDNAAAEAEYKRALAAAERASRPAAELAATYNNLASAYQSLGRDSDAERLYLKSIAMWDSMTSSLEGAARPLNNLGTLYRNLRRLAEAERCYRRSLAIRLAASGPTHPEAARVMNNIARVEQARGNYPAADELYRRALAIVQMHPDLEGEAAGVMSNYGALLNLQGKREAARQTLTSALEMASRVQGAGHPMLVDILVNAAVIELADKRYPAAEEMLRKALGIAEAKLGVRSPITATVLAGYATALRGLKRKQEAVEYERRSTAMLRSYRGSYTVDISEFSIR